MYETNSIKMDVSVEQKNYFEFEGTIDLAGNLFEYSLCRNELICDINGKKEWQLEIRKNGRNIKHELGNDEIHFLGESVAKSAYYYKRLQETQEYPNSGYPSTTIRLVLEENSEDASIARRILSKYGTVI